jgi:hypothetical protein
MKKHEKVRCIHYGFRNHLSEVCNRRLHVKLVVLTTIVSLGAKDFLDGMMVQSYVQHWWRIRVSSI